MELLFLVLLILLIYYYYLLIKNNKKEHFVDKIIKKNDNNDINNTSYNDLSKDYKIKVIYKKNTNYGDIIIGKNKEYGKCLIIDKEIQLCDKQENIYHEMMVHFPMKYLSHDPEYVLIIGGGDLMTLREVMKYKSIKKVIMLELNKDVVNICKNYFNVDDFSNNKKVEIIYGDANKTIDKLKLNFDLIISDTTEDNSTNLKIDKKHFFYRCYALLKKDGILVKNGNYFQNYFSDIFDDNTINYSFYLSYFQDYYYFTLTGKKDIKNSKLRNYNIDYTYYNTNDHYKYVTFEM